jgi:hypothetical protein
MEAKLFRTPNSIGVDVAMMGGSDLVEISLLVIRNREIGALVAICLATEFADIVK